MTRISSMMALTMVMLMVGAMGWTRCLDPKTQADQCENNECRITGQSRRRLGRVYARFCLAGEYKEVWYKTTTKEAQCNATPTAASLIAETLPAHYESYHWDLGMGADTAADRWAASSGQCFSTRRRRGSSGGPEPRKTTCKGVADGSPPVTMAFSGTSDCNATAATGMWNYSMGGHRVGTINNKPAPCMCHWQDQVRSECATCSSKEELQCSTEALCNAAEDKKCSWSGSSCTCKTGNYRRPEVCHSGKLHHLYFQTSSYEACRKTPPVEGTYLKFPTANDGIAETCRDQSGTEWNGTHSIAYNSKMDTDCAGVADFGEPRHKFFTGSGCLSANLVYSKPIHRSYWNDCTCMLASWKITSDCSGCSGIECSTKDACMMSREGVCAWNPAAAVGSQCTCSTGTFESSEHCYDGKPAIIRYDGTNAASRCAAGGNATFHRPKDVSTDDSWTSCDKNHDGSEQGTHMMKRSCHGQANGAAAATIYFNDANCTSVNHTKARKNHRDSCKCVLSNGCKAGTTFEKYLCAGTDAVTAVEYSDGLCTTKTGVKRSLKSVTDALNLGVCGAWPPIALKPKFDFSLMLQCPKKDSMVKVTVWDKASADTMTLKCSPTPPATEALNTGDIEGCYCKNELMFNALAKEKNVQISGDLSMQVSDVKAALEDNTFKKIVKSTIAENAGVSPSNIVDLKMAVARRLNAAGSAASPRMLASGGIKATYLMVVPKTIESAVQNSMKATSVNSMADKIMAKIANAPSVTFNATVTGKTILQSAPATVAVTTTGSVEKQGVDAAGVAKTNPEISSTRASSQVPSTTEINSTRASSQLPSTTAGSVETNPEINSTRASSQLPSTTAGSVETNPEINSTRASSQLSSIALFFAISIVFLVMSTDASASA